MAFLNRIVSEDNKSVVDWAEKNAKLPGSALSNQFDCSLTPWTREPLERANDGTEKMTFIKPIQCGGSTVGEIAILFWLANWSNGNVCYYWPNETVATDRWMKEMEKKLRACKSVMDRTSEDRFKFTKGLVIFPHGNFVMQGAFTDRNVASDSFRGLVNEELHDADGWLPGRLEQAYGRTTAVWNRVVFNISNASRKGDQLHQAFTSGTQQHWEVLCPGCGKFHRMRARWDEARKDLGGLRYDADGCRLDTGEVNYGKLLPTIRYQMPCGYTVHDDVNERRALSLSGRYSEPNNTGAPLTERSYTLEAVSVDYVPWVDLIRKKHMALRARKLGDPKPWLDYLRERECQFIGIEDRRPESVAIVLSSRKKDREGLTNRMWRFGVLDYQTGRKQLGETPHFWLVIQDFDPEGNALIVWEGKLGSEGEVIDVLKRHGVKPIATAVDASFLGEDRYVYSFCLRYGFNCFKVHGKESGAKTFTHEDGIRRAWSEPEPLWPRAPGQQGPSKNDPNSEPEFFNLSQAGALDALAHLRARKDRRYEIPADVSEDFKAHFLPWSLEEWRVPATNQIELRWRKASEAAADHLYMCCSYIAIWAEMAGATGEQDIAPDAPAVIQPSNEKETHAP